VGKGGGDGDREVFLRHPKFSFSAGLALGEMIRSEGKKEKKRKKKGQPERPPPQTTAFSSLPSLLQQLWWCVLLGFFFVVSGCGVLCVWVEYGVCVLCFVWVLFLGIFGLFYLLLRVFVCVLLLFFV